MTDLYFFSYQEFQNFRLPQDDKNGALSLYPPRRSRLKPLKLEKCGGDLSETDGPSQPASTTGSEIKVASIDKMKKRSLVALL